MGESYEDGKGGNRMGSKFVMADPRKCVGCKACMAACLVKHYVPGDIPVSRLNVVAYNGMTSPVACHHCADAPCAAACPTQALYKDGDRVGVRMERCIGCASCVTACPYGAVRIESGFGMHEFDGMHLGARASATVIKCDRCYDRTNGPACVEACTSHALRLVDQDQIDAALKKAGQAPVCETGA